MTGAGQVKRFEQAIADRLTALGVIVAKGESGIDGDRFKIPKLKALRKDPAVEIRRKFLFSEIDSVHLPDLIIDVDERRRFSSVLLGRQAASNHHFSFTW